ncbi:sugar phosphate nucleotidyltransferase, partial [Planococcus sp. Urea-trap-24]
LNILKDQLNDIIPTVIEPETRDTFGAVALSVLYMLENDSVTSEEPICIFPVDILVDHSFIECIKNICEKKRNSSISLIGVNPTSPSEKYGYILPLKNELLNNEDGQVKLYVEKPTKLQAQTLIENGALWNSGVSIFTSEIIITWLKNLNLPLTYNELLTKYNEIPNISFDYQVLAQTEQIFYTKYSGKWKDLGTWDSITQELNQNIIGKGTIQNSENTHLFNELEIPIIVQGIQNAVVSASINGILVCSKDEAYLIKDAVDLYGDDCNDLFVEKNWGWYKILDHSINSAGQHILTKKLHIKENNNISYQFHEHRDETWTIIDGKGILVIDNQIFDAVVGKTFHIPSGSKHSIKALTSLEIIEIQSGSQTRETDIIRISNDWEEIISLSLVQKLNLKV